MKPNHEAVEPVLLLLAGLMIFFTATLFACEHFFNNDGQVFQVMSGLLTGISGAFLMRIKPRGPNAIPDPDNTTTASTVTTVTTPPVVPLGS